MQHWIGLQPVGSLGSTWRAIPFTLLPHLHLPTTLTIVWVLHELHHRPVTGGQPTYHHHLASAAVVVVVVVVVLVLVVELVWCSQCGVVGWVSSSAIMPVPAQHHWACIVVWGMQHVSQ